MLSLLSGFHLCIHLLRGYRPDFEPVLFIHGLGGSSAIRPVIEASGLASTRKDDYVRRPGGHGLSPLSGHEIPIVNYAENTRAVLDVRVCSAIMIGRSKSGVEFCNYPDVSRKLDKRTTWLILQESEIV